MTASYDAVGNVTSVNTTLANGTGGTDNQAFCYDDLNRLVWAGSTGTPSCGGTLTPGTLSSAAYTATYSYDTLNRLTSGPLGSYTYGDPAHLDAATSVGTGSGQYTASYDASGDMECRAPNGSTTCTGGSGATTGAAMTYDAERRLSSWQNAPSSPSSQAWYLYDGEGHRVEQDVTTGGGSDQHTYYLPGNVEEVTPSGGLIKYYAAGGLSIGENITSDASGISYLASDGLGSVSEALNQTGTATGAVLYDPYGNVRYSNGTLPTAKGFTGQYSDASTGLDYYSARYYDPALGQFTSADTVADAASGLNRYGYVKGNPETATDPTGHMLECRDGGTCGQSKPPPPGTPPERAASHAGECDNEPAICEKIMGTFHNHLTQDALLYIAETGSSIGMKILKWILNIGKTLGDKFISWDIKAGGPGGYTDSGGWIHMQDQGDATNANALIHEGVEAYYAIQYGVRSQASQQMDYLAQRYSGMYKSDGGYSKDNGCDADGENCQYYGAYTLSFEQWRATKDGKGYAGQPLVQAEVQFGAPIAPGHVLYRTGPFGLFLGAKAVNGGSIAELDAAYHELSLPLPYHDPAPIV